MSLTKAQGHIRRLLALLFNRKSVEPTKEALLTAICIGSRPLVEFILSLFYEFPGEERSGACDLCGRSARCLTNSVILLDTYRAISSAPFLWLACSDPLLAALNLAVDLEVCEEMEKEHKVAYGELRRNVAEFALRIVEQCWNMNEIDTLLSYKEGATLADDELRFPRITLALQAHMKSFLASIGVQTAMEGQWHGMWMSYGKSACQDFSRHLRHIVFYPFLATIHAFSAGKYIKTFKYPLARYMSRLASYISFLIVLICIRCFGREGEQASERALLDSGEFSFLKTASL
ncbi:unnamed protein product [Gongylonema pulchrum]|uniref:TRP_2 domain-containing protein n=1 Tax=Gongylonema pulchrum TaxID=637853 RepID=A0A183E362_9BILA|nr:unnamed protein product [Gongylonema pulchrum]